MIFGKNRAFLYPTKVLADTNNILIDICKFCGCKIVILLVFIQFSLLLFNLWVCII